MINVKEISKSYGSQVLFKDLSFTINKGEKVALIGRNGYGKTTLFKMLLGEIEQDSGNISIPNDYKIGHLQQHLKFTDDIVLKEGCRGLPPDEKDAEWKVKKVLFGLGFSEKDIMGSPELLSEGYKIRLCLAKVIVSNPDLLLLDEPNNYLDIVAIRWLIDFLKSWRGELILISHDRGFIDSVTSHSMMIYRKKIRKIEGDTQKLYEQIIKDEEIYEKTRQNEERKRKQTEIFITKFRAKARLGGMVQSRIKSLEKQENKAKLEKIESLDFSFSFENFTAAQMMKINNLNFSFDQKEPHMINDFSMEIGKNDRICVIGKNGKGKSTLLKLIAGELTPISGDIQGHYNLKTGCYAQNNVHKLSDHKTVVEEIMSGAQNSSNQKARNICGTLMFGGDSALKPISVLSGGEKNRVMLGKLLVTPAHLLLLDEPTNHLDLESCEALIEAIDEFEGSVIMVTHNEMFLKRVAERIVIFDNDQISMFEGSYDDFLKDVGWSDENESAGRNSNIVQKNDKPGKQELKKLKAQIRQERAKILKPMEAEIEKLEKTIHAFELDLDKNTQLLIESSNKGDAGQITELSIKDKELRSKIDHYYERLDEAVSKHDDSFKMFEEKLNALESAGN
jgi:ATP-binding cassette subfamily F protein 3